MGAYGLFDAVSGAPSFIGSVIRPVLGALVGSKAAARPLGGRSGVAPGTPATTVTATSTTWTVQPHAGILDLQAAAASGPAPYAFTTAQTGSMTAADATNQRIDLISIRHDDPSQGDGSTVPLPVVVYTAGNPLTGAVPATPARCMAVAQITVPASGGGSPTVAWVAPYATAAGGITPVSALNPYPASPYVGQYVDDASLGGLVRWNGSAWVGGGDTGWVTSGVSGAGSNVISSLAMRRVGSLVQIGFAVTLSGPSAASLSSGVTGNIGNSEIAFLTDSRFIPTHAGPLGSGPAGVMLTGAVATDGTINVNALVPSITFSAGDIVSVAGTYLVD